MRMRFREIKEIREIRNETQKPDPNDNNYKKIKPQTGTTVEEAYAYWDNFLNSLPDEIIDPDGVDDLPDQISL